jgi:hypothetical protein
LLGKRLAQKRARGRPILATSFIFRPSGRCLLVMLWTAPPPPRKSRFGLRQRDFHAVHVERLVEPFQCNAPNALQT